MIEAVLGRACTIRPDDARFVGAKGPLASGVGADWDCTDSEFCYRTTRSISRAVLERERVA